MITKSALIGLFMLLFVGVQEAYAQPYKVSAGIRFPFGIGLNGKYFLNEQNAVEGILNFRFPGTAGFNYTYITLTGLYEWQFDLDQVLENLDWYAGAGASLAFFGGDWDFPGSDFNSVDFGISGVIGLEYTFDGVPITVALDWIPSIYFAGLGFEGEGGLFAVRYVFP
jgi:hypothetical protein